MDALPRDVWSRVVTHLDECRDVGSWCLTCKDAHELAREDLRVARDSLHEEVCPRLAASYQRRRRDLIAAYGRDTGGFVRRIDWPEREIELTIGGPDDCGDRVEKGGTNYTVSIETDSNDAITRVLTEIAANRPRRVTVICTLKGTHPSRCNRALVDEHVRLLEGVERVSLMHHHALTDACLPFPRRAAVLEVKCCPGISGDVLPSLLRAGARLYSVQWIGGCGTRYPTFSDRKRAWLRRQGDSGLIVEQW